jgi:hypothetical protein
MSDESQKKIAKVETRPDVEAHKHLAAHDEAPEDETESPDVEAHKHLAAHDEEDDSDSPDVEAHKLTHKNEL